jgi:hypothetical protein
MGAYALRTRETFGVEKARAESLRAREATAHDLSQRRNFSETERLDNSHEFTGDGGLDQTPYGRTFRPRAERKLCCLICLASLKIT